MIKFLIIFISLLYANMFAAGSEGGDFIFVRKSE